MKSTKSTLVIHFLVAFLIVLVGWNSASANSNSFQNQEYFPQFQPSVNGTCDSWTFSNNMECPKREDPVKESGIDPQQSKTGPKPSLSVLENDKIKVADSLNDILSEVTLTVPAYLWRHGCGPTALGMIIGYYDTLGYSDLVDGSGSSQTEEVDQMIASGGETGNPNPAGSEEHYEDYASPQDNSPIMLDDSYITEGRTPHVDNSLADFMDTSKSTRNNYYGWSWSSDMGPAFIDYVITRNSSYQASSNFFYNISLTWDVLTGEIDSGRPMVFLVDSDGNGSTDHFVTVIGYRTSPTLQYAAWDTWSATVVRWENFEYIATGVPWGIWGGWSFNIEGDVSSNIFYVKPDVAGDCSNWDNACDLQTAISLAQEGDQIWVAAGTYKPTADTDRTATFQLKSGVAIYGGFPAEGGGWDTRDWETNLTALSGDIGAVGDNVDNSCKVVTSIGVDNATVLDGFTIMGGNANETTLYLTEGGGMYNVSGNPTLTNIIFTNNVAKYDGGGMYNSSSSPNLSNVTFSNNSAAYFGGGMKNYLGSPSLTNVTFSGNSSTNDGGGMYNSSSSPTLTNVTFNGNNANDGGGGMLNYHSSPSLSNVTFSDNSADIGGGMYNSSSSPTLTNITFNGNSALYGGGMYNQYNGNPTLTNCVIWGNIPDQIYNAENSSPIITFSDVQGDGVYPGMGNINEDPLLGSLADNGGFTLTHAIAAGSPAIDNGDPNNRPATDQRGFFRPVDGDGDGTATCDMGAYEYGSTGPGLSLFLPLVLK